MYNSKPMFDNSLRSPRGGRSFIRLAGLLLVLAAAIGSCWPYPNHYGPSGWGRRREARCHQYGLGERESIARNVWHQRPPRVIQRTFT